MTPEVLAQRIESMTADELAAVDQALTPQAIRALLMLMPELEPVLMQFAEIEGRGGQQAQPQQPDDSQAVQQFMQAVGAGNAGR